MTGPLNGPGRALVSESVRASTGRWADRTGVSAPEALVALLLGLFIAHLGLATMARLRTSVEALAARSDALVSMRVARHVLRRELRHAEAGRDWSVDGDSLALRAFRGTGLVCPSDTATAEITVAYTGDRRPDPAKDSVLIVDGLGGQQVRALLGVAAAPTACGPVDTSDLESWRLDHAVTPGSVVARLFEKGSYHVSGSALRYRRGESGRQPLTPEAWASGSGWVRSESRLGLAVRHREPSAGRDWSAFLAWLPLE